MVASVKPLRSVKDQSDQMFTHKRKLLNYDQYATLLLSAAINYDLKFVSSSSRSTRKFYNNELGDIDLVIGSLSEVAEDADYDVDESAATLLAKRTNHGNPNPDSYLPFEDYSSLTP